MAQADQKFRFLLIQAFHLSGNTKYQLRPMQGDKESMLTITTGLSMPTNGMSVFAELETNAMDETQEQRGETDGSTERSRFRRRSWP